ncbi:hypothetical protein CFC21_009157 [Triticum aestivum]|uniref:WRKY domain-containing protein n=2 Tax=Triticum aestivum TaxID=4565 RepID=A0A9R1DHU6_WHEAT|nr:transcription factor WRKY19-like [Triticum aestivum]KAF6992137.1 hypothetical protein CFC21_009157 [Triticum aestivum]
MEGETTLATELDGLLAMARELEARVDGDQGAPGAARELCAELAASVHRAVRLAGSEGNAGGRASVNGRLRSGRKAAAAARAQVRVASMQDLGPLDDGLSWRKYGQKDILGAPYPRAYFRCTHRHSQGCQATKQVQRAAADPLLFDVVYHGAHTCAQATALLAGTEQQPPAPFGQEQQSSPAAAPEGMQWPEEPFTPPSFPSSPAGCYTPGNSWCQLAGNYGYAAGGGLGADMEFDELFWNM